MTTTQTEGQALASALRRYFSVGPRTRRYRTRDGYRQDLHREMVEALMYAAQYPGYYSEATQAALRPGFGAALSYDKHVNGYRIDGTVRQRITTCPRGTSPGCSARWSTRASAAPETASGSLHR